MQQQTKAKRKNSSAPVSLQDIVLQIGSELRAIERASQDVEQAAAVLIESHRRMNQASIPGLQSLDIISQTLIALANFAENLAREMPREWTLDARTATDSIPLAALAHRMRMPAQRVSKVPRVDKGSLEIFD